MSQKKAARLNPSESELRSSMYAWVDDIEFLTKKEIDDVPEGWITLEILSEIKKIPPKTIEYQCKQACRRGEMQRKQFRIQAGRAKQMVWHYYKK